MNNEGSKHSNLRSASKTKRKNKTRPEPRKHTKDRTRLKGPPFNFFRHCPTFFRKKNSQSVPPSIFSMFCDIWMLENPKGPPFSFFRHCDFFSNLFFTKRSPLRRFRYFATECIFMNLKWSLLHFSALLRHFSKEKNFEIFKFFSKKNVLRFFSLRYSADFRLSRLVVDFSFFSFLLYAENDMQGKSCIFLQDRQTLRDYMKSTDKLQHQTKTIKLLQVTLQNFALKSKF